MLQEFLISILELLQESEQEPTQDYNDDKNWKTRDFFYFIHKVDLSSEDLWSPPRGLGCCKTSRRNIMEDAESLPMSATLLNSQQWITIQCA